LRIGIVCSGFNVEKPGGVSNVVINLLKMISTLDEDKVDLIAFSSNSSNRFQFMELDQEKNIDYLKNNFGIENVFYFKERLPFLEFKRYRKRNDLKTFFNTYDLIIVVTGVLQFANVLPKIRSRVIIQFATRLNWERKSRYRRMRWFRRVGLKIQYPILLLQEKCVLRNNYELLVENRRIKEWIESQTGNTPTLFYPTPKMELSIKNPNFQTRENNYFISVGRLDEDRKGWSRLLNSYELACQYYDNLPPLRIVGWGEFNTKDQKTYQRISANLDIKIFSNMTSENRNHMLADASFFLQTSYEEGLGLAAIEALSFGLPLICSKTFGALEYVHIEKNGFLIENNKNFVENFSRAIVESQQIDYLDFSRYSLNLYLDVFSHNIGRDTFVELIKNQARADL